MHHDEAGYPNFREFDARLHDNFSSPLKGDAKPYAKNIARNGLAAWQRIVKEFDPRELLDESVAYEAVARPTACKTIGEAKMRLPMWHNEAAEFEVKFLGKFNDAARCLAL